MAGERTHPILPCPDVDEAVTFYEALGFRPTFRQTRPNPYAVVELEDMIIHLAGIPSFDPTTSVSSVIITVPDADDLHADFAAGLRARYGRVLATGIPRLLRPRRKQGTATGFSVVDPGGNWLRFYRSDASEDEEPRAEGLARVVEAAARQGDARGDDVTALSVLDRGLARHQDAPALERARALLYRAELLVRLERSDDAQAAVNLARATVSAAEAAELEAEFAAADELLRP